ncbi:MAG: hypothetical protein AUI53_03030 [Acidobacteria bacterium 13_1_40CM_2_60_7]|nr:MAG: hypothetical protein AUI53_03030 [Acidobacteria bacterium 13_1_40CM_2_60_7]
MERREHYRVRLRLPARIRWRTPFEQRIEVRETLDVSRGVWLTFPFDSTIPDGQPEVPARVVRSERVPGSETRFGLRFEPASLHARNGHGAKISAQERRVSVRRPFAVPVRVRSEYSPWFEEAMTLDVSPDGLRFLSTREYEPGARLILWFNPGVSSPWRSRGEFRAVVVRSDPEPDGRALIVAVCRIRE